MKVWAICGRVRAKGKQGGSVGKDRLAKDDRVEGRGGRKEVVT